MNIVKRELRANLKSIIIWSLAIAFLVFVWMIEFESFTNNPAMKDFMDSIPKGALDALGMSELVLTNLSGFLSGISLYLYLLLGIQAVLLGSSIISKEERDKTAEYLFTLPISREKVIKSKIISGIINLIILNFVALGTTLLSSISYNKDVAFYKFLALLFLAIFIIQMIFFSIGMLVSSINKNHKKSGNISVSILIITFLIASFINMVASVDFLKYVTPFKYFDGSYILEQGRLKLIFLVISLIIIISGIGGTLFFYPKRDLHI